MDNLFPVLLCRCGPDHMSKKLRAEPFFKTSKRKVTE
jgi:hypothetical protein